MALKIRVDSGDWSFGEGQADNRVEGVVRQDDLGSMASAATTAAFRAGDAGPCLYLGPAGQRCYQRAVKDGFCAAHQPGVTARAKVAKRSKIAAAIAGILGALWPYVYDVVHALLKIFHPR